MILIVLQEGIYDRTENEDVGGRIRLLKKDYDQLMNRMLKRENNQRVRMMKKDSGKIRLLKRDWKEATVVAGPIRKNQDAHMV